MQPPSISSTAARGPAISANTEPSYSLRTQPLEPSLSASLFVQPRK